VFLKTFGQNISKTFKNKHPINSHPRGWVWVMISRLHPYVIIFFWVLNLTCKLSLTPLLHLVNCVLHFVIIFNCLLVIDAIIRFGLCFVCFFKFLSLLYFMHYCNVELCSTSSYELLYSCSSPLQKFLFILVISSRVAIALELHRVMRNGTFLDCFVVCNIEISKPMTLLVAFLVVLESLT